MALFVVFISLLNLGLGFAAAVLLADELPGWLRRTSGPPLDDLFAEQALRARAAEAPAPTADAAPLPSPAPAATIATPAPTPAASPTVPSAPAEPAPPETVLSISLPSLASLSKAPAPIALSPIDPLSVEPETAAVAPAVMQSEPALAARIEHPSPPADDPTLSASAFQSVLAAINEANAVVAKEAKDHAAPAPASVAASPTPSPIELLAPVESASPVQAPATTQAPALVITAPAIETPVDETPAVAAPSQPAPAMASEPASPASPADNLSEAFDTLLVGLRQYRSQLSGIDERIRGGSTGADASNLKEYVEQFRSCNGQYLDSTRASAARLFESAPVAGDLATIRAALLTQANEVKQTDNRLAEWTPGEDVARDCGALLKDTGRLIEANVRLRDELETSRIMLGREEGWLAQVSEGLRIDELTGLPSRVAIEGALDDHCQAPADQPLFVGLIDVDHCHTINEQLGPTVGDQVLRGVAQTIAAYAGDDDMPGRYDGQKFIMLFPGATFERASTVIEQVRQGVESTTFLHAGARLPVTVSCGIVAATAGDTTASLAERLQSTLTTAKQQGGNCTFEHQAERPAPATVPVLSIPSASYEV